MTDTTSTPKRYDYKDRYGTDWKIFFVGNTYAVGGGMAIDCWCEFFDEDFEEACAEPYAPITVNLGETCPERCAFVDTNNSRAVIEWLEDNGLASPTGNSIQSGFCFYPEYRFTKEFMEGVFVEPSE